LDYEAQWNLKVNGGIMMIVAIRFWLEDKRFFPLEREIGLDM
jgi:hypothetical protein